MVLTVREQDNKKHIDAHFAMRHAGPAGPFKLVTELVGEARKWKDVSRTQGSVWGPNITDVGMKIDGSDDNLFIYASKNTDEMVYQMRANECNLLYPDKEGGLRTCNLEELSKNLAEAFPDHNLNKESFFEPIRDATVTVSFQVIFAPADPNGECNFMMTAFNYNNGTDLRGMFHASGASLSQAERGIQELGSDVWDADEQKWKKCPFHAKLTGRTCSEAQEESAAQAAALEAQGISTLQQIGPPACGKSSDTFLLVTWPAEEGDPDWIKSAATIQITSQGGVGYIEPGTNKVYSKENKGFVVPSIFASNCCNVVPFGVAYVQPDKRAFIPLIGFKTLEETVTINCPTFGLGWKQPHNGMLYIPGKGLVHDPTAPPPAPPVSQWDSDGPMPRGLSADADPSESASRAVFRGAVALPDEADAPRFTSCGALAASDVEMADAGHMAVSTGAPKGDAIGVRTKHLQRNKKQRIRVTITIVVGLPGGLPPTPESLDAVCARVKKLEETLQKTGGGARLMESGLTVAADSAEAIAGNAAVAAAFAAKVVPPAPKLAPRPPIRKPTAAPFAERR